MAKSLKKYKRPPRTEREPIEDVETTPVQEEAMKALDISPNVTPVKKKTRQRRKRAAPKSEASGDEVEEDRVDSGVEDGALDFELPVSLT